MQQPEEIWLFSGKNLLLGLILSLGLSACSKPSPTNEVVKPQATPRAASSSCTDIARLDLEFSGGGMAGGYHLAGPELQCESMRRPNDEGARLRFGFGNGELRFALIAAIPELDRGEVAKELPANLTFSVEYQDRTRFFGTQGTGSCWADIHSQVLLESSRYDIAGEVYCIAPLSEINGDSSVTIVELFFATELDWDLT